jgi:hypothetical protein
MFNMVFNDDAISPIRSQRRPSRCPGRTSVLRAYLDDCFEGEYEKLQEGYAIDPGDPGIYRR